MITLFEHLSRRELDLVETLVTPITFSAGDVLCHQGAVGREAFILTAGSAVVTRDGVDVAEIGAGAVVGELALQGDGYRNATVTATTEVTALVVNPREFRSLLALPGVAEQLRSVQERRSALLVESR